MTDFHALIHSYQNCACGQAHTCAIRDIEIGSGLVRSVGDILRKNGFGPRLLLAADEQTLAAAEGIEASLAGFAVVRHIWPTIRVATMQDVEKIESYFDRVDGVLAVGTGSVHDPCRLACRAARRAAVPVRHCSVDGRFCVLLRAHREREFQDHVSRQMSRGHHRRHEDPGRRPGGAQIRGLRRYDLQIRCADRLAGIESSDRGILL